MIGRMAQRSNTDIDDKLVALVHRPIFLSFVLLGLGLATQRVGMAEAPEFITLGILKTIAIGVWYNMFRNFATLAVHVGERRTGSKFVQSGMLQLLQNVIMVVLFALAVYFVFIAWNIEVTAWLASAGIVGLALSFAAKDTLSNLFAGVSIVADAPYKHGDFILLCWIERPVNRGRLQHELNCAVYRAFAANEIEIAFPQRDLHVRTMAPASGSTE